MKHAGMARALCLLCLAILALYSAGCATPQALVMRVAELKGEYRGVVWSDGGNLPIATFLGLNSSGVLQGRYVYEDGTNAIEGVLYDFRKSTSQSIECTWNDDFGIGILQMRFSRDLQRFDGCWGENGKVNRKNTWNGFKIKSPDDEPVTVDLEVPDGEVY